ncbi:hypothetical protein [Streptacidiphilus sp. P02-A3a]|uniref:hypothetical protein n=1 Tax=Streptacidiphilus sp. P02-A3a TaxID=2704468 RepID=UPI0015F9C015|nr:hypothetical protein [Streptacidiphilus sp. P02-A3a]QMU73433.1 hypothetical protein GXP74_39625 [Streptacidiphilus sp. P02-A3a]
MNGLPPAPADRPLPDRDRRRHELLALIRREQERDPGYAALAAVPGSGGSGNPLDVLDADGTLGDTIRIAAPLSGRRSSGCSWSSVAAVAASVVLIGAFATLGLRDGTGGGVPAARQPATATVPVLNGIRPATAQSQLTGCLQAAVDGRLTSGNYFSTPRPTDPVGSYRVVIAEPHLYRAMENGLSTWIIGKGPSGQLAGCSVPQDASNPNGREALLGSRPSGALNNQLTVEYSTGGVSSPALDGTRASVYANTLVGRYGDEITRITVRYPGGREHNAQMAEGVWFDQSQLASAGMDGTGAVVHGYGANGALLFSWTESAPSSGR